MPHRALTPRHLLVLHAALRFWQEEMQPYRADLMATYLNDASPGQLPDEDDVTWVADNFDRYRVRYAAVSLDGNRLLYDRLFVEPVAAEQALGTTEGRVATLLLLCD